VRPNSRGNPPPANEAKKSRAQYRASARIGAAIDPFMFRDAFDREESPACTLTGNGTTVKPVETGFGVPGRVHLRMHLRIERLAGDRQSPPKFRP